MKNKIYLIFIGLLLGIFPLKMTGQTDGLKVLLQGKTTFKEITSTFEQYLATMPDGTDKERMVKPMGILPVFAPRPLGRVRQHHPKDP
jgi:hypothetical protein